MLGVMQARGLVQLGGVKRAGERLTTAIEYATSLEKRDI